MKDEIIVNKKSDISSGYKCDMSKPYSFVEDQVSGLIFGLVFISSLMIGIILLVLCTPPSISEDSTKLWPIIIFSIIGLLMIPMLSYYCAKAIREKRHLVQMLSNALVFTGIMEHIQSDKKWMYKVTIKLDDGNTIDVITKSRYFQINQKVAVARYFDRQFLLTQCTLIENLQQTN